jgi:hypothetical protein
MRAWPQLLRLPLALAASRAAIALPVSPVAGQHKKWGTELSQWMSGVSDALP